MRLEAREDWLAGAAALLCLGALAANFLLPWISVDSGESDAVGRASLADSPLAYERRLVQWPAVALPVAAIALAVAAAPAWLPRSPRRAQARHTAWLVAAAAGFVVSVTAARWLGLQVARLLDPGPAVVHLQGAPYANLAAGAAVLGLAGWRLARLPVRLPPAAVACAATLLAVPLVPFGAAAGSFALQIDEHTLALAAQSGGPLDVAADALGQARIFLWIGAGAALAVQLAAAWTPDQRWLAWASAALLLPLLAAAALAVRFQWLWMRLDAVEPGWNSLLPVGALAGIVLQARRSIHVLLASRRPAPALAPVVPPRPEAPPLLRQTLQGRLK